MIYLNGLYVEPMFYEGIKGVRLFHDSEYFREKQYVSKDNEQSERWLRSLKEHAQYFDVNKRYDRIRMLGKGKFSTVYLCRTQDGSSEDPDDLVAMKLIDKKQLTRKEREFLRDEIQIIRSICHPNVVEMRDAFETHQHMYIMMECISGGELFEHIKDYEISEREACLVTHQVLSALQYLHMCGIVHRDLKPENIMIELDSTSGSTEIHQVKLTDFGLSKIIVPGEIMQESCGTPAYVAPEVL